MSKFEARFGTRTTEGRAIYDRCRPHVAIGYLALDDDELYAYDENGRGVLIGSNLTDAEALALITDWFLNGRA